MIMWEKAEFIINIVLTIISAVGAYNSIRYFKKSKHITLYAQSNKALGELGEMIRILPDVLFMATASTGKKGFSLQNAISEKGTELANHLNVIMDAIPSAYSAEFRALQRTEGFDLEQYINSFIDKTVLITEDGVFTLDRSVFDTCQVRLREMQEFLKLKIAEEEEKLK